MERGAGQNKCSPKAGVFSDVLFNRISPRFSETFSLREENKWFTLTGVKINKMDLVNLIAIQIANADDASVASKSKRGFVWSEN